jgi:hypothetical protein
LINHYIEGLAPVCRPLAFNSQSANQSLRQTHSAHEFGAGGAQTVESDPLWMRQTGVVPCLPSRREGLILIAEGGMD